MRLVSLLVLMFSFSLFAQIRPTPPIDFAQSSLCKKVCQNGNLSLYFMTHGTVSATRDCPSNKASTTISCGAYQCNQNGNECLTTCSDNSQCAAGYICNTQIQKCMTLSYQCSSNTTISGTDGSSYDCLPYVCSAGRCLERCTLTTHCSPGFVCDTSTNNCIVP